MKRRVAACLLIIGFSAVQAAAEPLCKAENFEGTDYTVCRIDTAEAKLEVFNLDATGAAFGTFMALAEGVRAEGRELLFAMNGGMFGEDLKPIGLYVEDGVQAHRLNRKDGYGNFHLKPNGVFYVKGDKLGVVNSDDYARSGLKPDYATQSGPMLVINGEIHPRFSETGASQKIRNGVGAVNDHTAVFVLSENAVNFYQFARFFRDQLGTKNALFLDGSVSALYATEINRTTNFVPLGPMVGAIKKQ